MKKQTLLLVLVLYVVSAVASYSVFSKMSTGVMNLTDEQIEEQANDEETLLASLIDIQPNEPQDQACPLNGKMYTKTERDAWEKHRPLAVMIENHPEARPQSGLGSADIVFETVAEGGVTRFMGMFLCDVQRFETTLAPIRSARTYFIDWASGFNNPLYVHVGGANLPGPANALGQINDYGWAGENDLNQFSIGYPTFVRDYNRVEGKEIATEHTMVTTTELLWEVGEERGWTNMSPDLKVGKKVVPGTNWYEGYTGWTFQDEAPAAGSTTTISYDFWSGYGDYSVKWEYDSASKTYKRFMAGEAHNDMNDNKQIEAVNVIVMLTTEKGPIDEAKHMLYGTTGTGDALIFQNGNVIKGSWSKKDRESELKFVDDRGKDVALARGLTWISVLNKVNEVQY
jgi:hypothetical protein